MILVMPSSTTYELEGYAIGGAGGIGESETYDMNASLGEVSGSQMVGEEYDIGPGLSFVQQAFTPPAPTLSNPANYYNKLLLVVNPGGNPSDAQFAVAISTDGFVTSQYVKADGTVGETLELADYRTYTQWGEVEGELIIGLESNTTYEVRAAAMQGAFTETGYGPIASAATQGVSLTFDLDVSAVDENTAPPHIVDLGILTAGDVVTATDKIWIDLSTNGEGGGFVYVYSAYGGLQSDSASYLIDSISGNLSSANEGYGIRADSLAQASGGPFQALSPYDGSGENIGAVTLETSTLLNSDQAPIVNGRASLLVKAKVSTQTPAAGDYTDALTLIASAAF